jgi:RNA polymerase sigma-70 factor (ECF subfamily)
MAYPEKCNGTTDRYTSVVMHGTLMLPRMDEPRIAEGTAEIEFARQIMAAAPGCARDAESELYRRFAPRVRLYGLRHLRDEHEAADLMQQVMVVTVEQLRSGKLREPERIASFVFGVCRMVVLERRRGLARRERLLELYGSDIAIADASIAPRFDRDRVARCLDRLPERERTVLLMTFYEEKPAKDVAAALGVSIGNVRVIRHRGLEHLRDCVMQGEAEP